MKRILIADDHAVVRMGLKLMLNDVAIIAEVDEAWNAETVMVKMKEHPYDLVLLDIQMPSTDPVILMHWLNSFYPKTNILIVSQNPEEVYGRRYLQLGAKGFLRKTATEAEMHKAVTHVLNGKKYVSDELARTMLDFAIEGTPSNPFDTLSHREFQVAVCLAKDHTINEICELLQVEYSTANTHKRRLFEKLNIENKKDLVQLAVAYNLLD